MGSTSRENTAGVSAASSKARTEKSGSDELPIVMHEMKISENKSDNNAGKVIVYWGF